MKKVFTTITESFIDPPTGIIYPASSHLSISVLLGLFSGLAEVVVLGIKKFLFHKFLFMGIDAIWVIPLSDTIIFILLCFCLLILYRLFPTIESRNLTIFLFSFIGHFIWLTVSFGNVPKIGLLFLAAGLAKQSVLLLNRIFLLKKPHHHDNDHKIFFNRYFANHDAGMIVSIGLIILILFSIVQSSKILIEKRQIANLQYIPPDSPNVLLIVLDTVRADSLSLYGYGKATSPNLSKIAESGVVFTQAYTSAPWTLPAHGSIFTGKLPSKLSVSFEKPLDDTYPTIAEILKSYGYLTAGFVANTTYCSSETGLNRGFIHYEDYGISFGEALNSSQLLKWVFHSKLRHALGYYQVPGRKSAEQVNKDFLKWLSKKDSNKPFFAFLNYYDAHDPYIPPEDFNQPFATDSARNYLGILGTRYSEQEQEELNASYDATIYYLDYQIGQLYEQLQELNTGDTFIIIVSDHGEQFGEHGLVSHANSLYRPLLYVPLIMLAPEAPKNLQVGEVVSLIDIPATIMDYVGVGADHNFSGTSLIKYWTQENPGNISDNFAISETEPGAGQPDWYPSAKGSMISLVINGYHYIRNGDGSEELYWMKIDPTEENNLIKEVDEEQLDSLFENSLIDILRNK